MRGILTRLQTWAADRRFAARWWRAKKQEQLAVAVVWRLPRYWVYWAAIRVWAYATTGPYGQEEVNSVGFNQALTRWRPPQASR